VAQRRVGEETVVLDLRRGRVYGLNPSGGEVLELLRGGSSVSELRAWAAAAGDGESTLEPFLATLVEHGLAVPAADSGEPVAAAAPRGVTPWIAPRLLWHEDAARVTHQTSPPQQITNPQCQP
jgi:hypothetical protein